MLGRFEYNSRAALSRLVRQLATDDDSPAQSSEKSHERYWQSSTNAGENGL
jgi:hypothetical protein